MAVLILAPTNRYAVRLDTEGHTAIAVMPIPDEGLGRAVNDLLKLAAAPA